MSDAGVQIYSGPGGPSWKVVQAIQTTSQAANGQFVRGWEVTYQLDGGHQGTVFLPSAQFNPDMVRQLVTDAAAKLYAIVTMTG